jgi:hypothetical protein
VVDTEMESEAKRAYGECTCGGMLRPGGRHSLPFRRHDGRDGAGCRMSDCGAGESASCSDYLPRPLGISGADYLRRRASDCDHGVRTAEGDVPLRDVICDPAISG